MKKKIKDLRCTDIKCSNCPFEDHCSWVVITPNTFEENFKLHIREIEAYINELEKTLEQEIEVEEDVRRNDGCAR